MSDLDFNSAMKEGIIGASPFPVEFANVNLYPNILEYQEGANANAYLMTHSSSSIINGHNSHSSSRIMSTKKVRCVVDRSVLNKHTYKDHSRPVQCHEVLHVAAATSRGHHHVSLQKNQHRWSMCF
jgi:hypothetical protein